ncbi:MAG: ribonuclease D [Alphaproteobacteria bacterium]|nr:ribonuclease D [Alphaproteobacteria bacterium]
MVTLTTTADLAAFCERMVAEEFITVDTEFLRETTYYPKLCLIQVAGAEEAALIDPLSDGIDLAPFFALMANSKVLKVFHAARQDFEILIQLSGGLPQPVIDTQIAAMVCGFGDQVGYEAIVRKLVGAQIDKSSQFTDWSRRPLTAKQALYAISDVTHLRVVYEKLRAQLHETGREGWLDDEIALLVAPSTYQVDPEESYRRIKARIQNKRQMGVLMSIAAWREREAQNRNVPRGRVLKDEALAEIAIQMPQKPEDINDLRLVSKGTANSSVGAAILKSVAHGLARDPKSIPDFKGRGEEMTPAQQAVAEVLKLALKVACESENVAPKLLASAADIDAIAVNDDAQVALLQGWRREVFGAMALDIKHGKACIGLENGRAVLIKRSS